MTMNNPGITVLIPCRNEERDLPGCLQSVVDSNWPVSKIIVIDDESTDNTNQIAHDFRGVTVVVSGDLRPGFTGQTNALLVGAMASRTDWILWMDADARLKPYTLETVEPYIADNILISIHPTWDVPGRLLSQIQSVMGDVAREMDSAAWGKFMLVHRNIFIEALQEPCVHASPIVDTMMRKTIDAMGGKTICLEKKGLLISKMYLTIPEAIDGWTRNVASALQGVPKLTVLGMLPRFIRRYHSIAGFVCAYIFVRTLWAKIEWKGRQAKQFKRISIEDKKMSDMSGLAQAEQGEGMNIVKAVSSDFYRFADLLLGEYLEEQMYEFGMNFNMQATKGMNDFVLDNNKGFTFLAENQAGDVIGFIHCQYTPGSPTDPLYMVCLEVGWYVRPDCRNKGAGGALLKAAEAEAALYVTDFHLGISMVTEMKDDLLEAYERRGYAPFETKCIKRLTKPKEEAIE